MLKQCLTYSILVTAVSLAACSTPPNPNLEQAKSNFSVLERNPKSSQLAALETKDASDWLQKAENAYREQEDSAKVDQLAYLTTQRIEVAKQTILLRNAEEGIKNSSGLRAQARLDARDAQLDVLRSRLNGQKTSRGTMVVFGDVLFDLDRSDLKSNGLVDVNKLAAYLRENPDRNVIVEGYTDSTGSPSTNLALSERRAASLKDALIRMGVEPTRIIEQGYGERYPVADNSTPAGKAQNRRVEVTISNDDKPVAPRSSMQ
ncbi:hypothetical protein AO073_06025 [Pseudomonas syringae ICMP 11293]|uniref:OmpA family protein n=1 Tax=Pseudomonas syringae TaxID=317 RepID=UPI000730A626|nr:OmpA family protein [Pseudomonas syringae]KTB91374.1 hypothetical protein AO073_06025 [Pseudomonas syringae ICMP 11293]